MTQETTPIEVDLQSITSFFQKMDIEKPETIIPNLGENNDELAIFSYLIAPLGAVSRWPEKEITKTTNILGVEKSKNIVELIAAVVNKATVAEPTEAQKRHACMLTSLIFGRNPDERSLINFSTMLGESDNIGFDNAVNLLKDDQSILCSQDELKRLLGGPKAPPINRAVRYRLIQLYENGLQTTDVEEQLNWHDLQGNVSRCLDYLKIKYPNS